MRDNPWLIRRIAGFLTEALVRPWNLYLLIFHAALWTCPDGSDPFSPLVAQTVVDPVHDTGYVQECVALVAIPYWICLLYGGYTYQADSATGLEGID